MIHPRDLDCRTHQTIRRKRIDAGGKEIANHPVWESLGESTDPTPSISSAVSGGALDWQFEGRDCEVLRQIWPRNTFSIVWPPPTMKDHDADRIAGAMMELALRVVGLPTAKQLLPGG